MNMIRKNKQEDALKQKIRFVISGKGKVATASVLNYFLHLFARQGIVECKPEPFSVDEIRKKVFRREDMHKGD